MEAERFPAREEVQFAFVVDLLDRVSMRLKPLAAALDDDAFNELVCDVVKFELNRWRQDPALRRDDSPVRWDARVRAQREGGPSTRLTERDS